MPSYDHMAFEDISHPSLLLLTVILELEQPNISVSHSHLSSRCGRRPPPAHVVPAQHINIIIISLMNTISSNDDELPLNHSRQFIWHLNRHNTNTNTPPDLGGAAASRLMGGYDVSLSSPRRPGPPPELYTNLDRPPVTPLPKGKACLECRRRKVRCDAQSPCKACIRMQKECIYEEEEERIRRLLVEVEELEMKLQLMEERKGDVGEGGEKVAAGGTVEQVAVTPSSEFIFRLTSCMPHADRADSVVLRFRYCMLDATSQLWRLMGPFCS